MSHPGEEIKLPPEIQLEGVRFRIERGGETQAVGRMDRVDYRRDTTDVQGTGIQATLRSEAGPVELTAPQGLGNVAERTFAVSGGVVARRNGDRAVTESARFEPSTDRRGGVIRGDRPVEVTGPGYRLEGPRFTVDTLATAITIPGGARLVTTPGVRR